MIDVEPAEMNGSGKPVGGTNPETTATFKITWIKISEPIPAESKHPNLSLAFFATLIMQTNKSTKTTIKTLAPTKPVSSAIIEKIKSDSANGKNKYFCLELNKPEPNAPPSEIANKDCTNWKPSFWLDAKGSEKATSRLSLYGSSTINNTTRRIAGTASTKKCFSFAPPINSITTIKRAMQIVMDMFGSKMISTQKIPPTNSTGKSPLNDFILSALFESTLAAKTIKANFAISEGWNVMNLKFIHLVAP